MNKPTTIYQIILDKSGSMSDCIENTINGFNEQIHKIRATAAEFPEQEIRIGLTVFNSEVKHLYTDKTPAEASLLTQRDYVPSRETALLDAIGQTCSNIEGSIRQADRVADTTVVVVIITDGYGNCSREFSIGEIRLMIERLEASGKWTFSFIGATLDAVDTAAGLSIKRQNSYSFSKENMDDEVWGTLSGSMSRYMKKKRKGKDLGNLFED